MSESNTYPEDRKKQKLDTLVESEGFDNVQDLLEAFITDSVAPAICMNLNCEYTTEMEPDQTRGYCEACGSQTVQSAFILADII